jgi:hypothetical protein
MTPTDAWCYVKASIYRASIWHTLDTPHSEWHLWTRDALSWPLLAGFRNDKKKRMNLMDARCCVMASTYRASGWHTLDTSHSEGLIWTRIAVPWQAITGIRNDKQWIPNTQNYSYGRVMLCHGLHLQGFGMTHNRKPTLRMTPMDAWCCVIASTYRVSGWHTLDTPHSERLYGRVMMCHGLYVEWIGMTHTENPTIRMTPTDDWCCVMASNYKASECNWTIFLLFTLTA